MGTSTTIRTTYEIYVKVTTEMEKYNLIKLNKKSRVYSRETAQKSLKNVIQRISEANRNDEFIYKITRAVLFGSYINSNKEKVGDWC